MSYRQRLASDARWALTEGSKFFAGKGGVQEALHRITQHLNQLHIPYAVGGGLALFHHGYRKFTEVVDILVTPESLPTIHANLDGRGYLPPFARSKNLRDTDVNVKIEFLLTGDYPGDGKVKPVAFPDPSQVSITHDEINYLNLPTLIELKLASGMTNPSRLKDLADVLELIKIRDLPRDLVQQLAPYVQDEYLKQWTVVHEYRGDDEGETEE